jgi:Transposase IS200 like
VPKIPPDRESSVGPLTRSEACQKTAWEVHAYCLMSNHFHLVVETPLGNLVDGMKWFLGTCTSRFNRRRVKAPQEGCPGQSTDCATAPPGDDGDLGLDRPRARDGRQRLRC